ncbi:MAG: hypothetical protein JWP25_3797 [Bradyrhizobium sp.]|nr:hypothetical protein [Bradyrhizobium sp.]
MPARTPMRSSGSYPAFGKGRSLATLEGLAAVATQRSRTPDCIVDGDKFTRIANDGPFDGLADSDGSPCLAPAWRLPVSSSLISETASIGVVTFWSGSLPNAASGIPKSLINWSATSAVKPRGVSWVPLIAFPEVSSLSSWADLLSCVAA